MTVARRARSSAGFATAETAVAMPVLVLVMVMAVWVLACVSAQLRSVDAARAAARVAARGDPPQAAAETGRRIAPSGATVQVVTLDGQVRVRVEVAVRPFGALLDLLPATVVGASAVAELEGP